MSKRGFTDEYHDHAWSEEATLSVSLNEEKRIERTLSLVPQDCTSILDIGCGDGRITNRLVSRRSKIVGLDSSIEALKQVKTAKIVGNIDCLPFPAKSFDLVLCCEVLEHLPYEVYPRALKEIERIAAKYVVVTVPENEVLQKAFVTCPSCGCIFHKNRHVRSFNTEKLEGLFGEFRLLANNPFRLTVKVYPNFLIKVAQLVRLMPPKPRNLLPTKALCPQCGYTTSQAVKVPPPLSANTRRSLMVNLVRPLAKHAMITKRGSAWLIALYQRQANPNELKG